MRHSLLPTSENTALHREYRFRLFIVTCIALSVTGLVGIGLLIPAYTQAFFAGRDGNSSPTLSSAQEQAEASSSQVSDELAGDAALISAIGAQAKQISFSGAIASIVALRGPVTITSMDMQEMPATTTTASFTIQGISPTRDDLVAFQGRLEGLAPGTTVDLPVSELVSKSDIQFSLQVTEPFP